jgi:hypothetical protein
MKARAKFLIALVLGLGVGERGRAQELGRGQLQFGLRHAEFAMPSSPGLGSSGVGKQAEVTRYVTGFDGDHSLNAATVAEQVFARYAQYTLRLQFASGREQSIAVTGPPGGLQPEMRDMSGDSIPNDLVFTSSLLRSPLVVLLNDGHDHLTVAISPGSFASSDGRASRPRQAHRISTLVTSRFKPRGNTGRSSPFLQLFEENLPSSIAPTFARRVELASRPGRAPPALVTAT